MTVYQLVCLNASDGSWEKFLDDWHDQCAEVNETLDDYAPDAMAALKETIESPGNNAISKQAIAAVFDGKHFVAACYLNWVANLPQGDGPTLRVRQVTVSPLVDYGTIDTDEYGNILVSLVDGIVKLSETTFGANNVKLHLRSPHDMIFFKALGTALDSQKVFASVQMRGAWLYIQRQP